MRLVFVTNNNIGSIFTRWWSWSEYSHVGLVHEDKVIHATVFNGVIEEDIKDFLKHYKEVKFCNVFTWNDEIVWEFARMQLGKPYDWRAIFGLLLRANYQEPDSWMCSELVATALTYGGTVVIRSCAPRVTPQDLLNSPLVIPESLI